MAKKSRRVKKREREIRLSPTQMVRPGVSQPADVPSVVAPAQEQEKEPRKSSLRHEYRYVITDLERIGVIAVAMLVLLIVLALLLT